MVKCNDATNSPSYLFTAALSPLPAQENTEINNSLTPRIDLLFRDMHGKNPESIPQDLCQDSRINHICSGNLGISRMEMPQLNRTTTDRFIQTKQNEGIEIQEQTLLASQLTPVQSELSSSIVGELLDKIFKGIYTDTGEMPVLASTLNPEEKIYVIDGHHRYAACRLTGSALKVIAIKDGIQKILSELGSFPGVKKVTQLDMPFPE